MPPVIDETTLVRRPSCSSGTSLCIEGCLRSARGAACEPGYLRGRCRASYRPSESRAVGPDPSLFIREKLGKFEAKYLEVADVIGVPYRIRTGVAAVREGKNGIFGTSADSRERL